LGHGPISSSLAKRLAVAKPQELRGGGNSFVARKGLAFGRVYWEGQCVEGLVGRKRGTRSWLRRKKSYFYCI